MLGNYGGFLFGFCWDVCLGYIGLGIEYKRVYGEKRDYFIRGIERKTGSG